MPGLIHRLLAPSPSRGIAGIVENNRHPLVLAVSADLGFYAGVLNAASSVRWRTEWARTLNRAIEICRLKSPPIVIYDSNLPGVEWGSAFDRLSAVPNHSRILLAAPRLTKNCGETYFAAMVTTWSSGRQVPNNWGGHFDLPGCLCPHPRMSESVPILEVPDLRAQN
jgi:hypothetical protein